MLPVEFHSDRSPRNAKGHSSKPHNPALKIR